MSTFRKIRLAIVGVVLLVVLIGRLAGYGPMSGHAPSTSDLVGRWVHHGKDLSVTLDLKQDGSFTREPANVQLSSNVWGGDIPTGGTWSLDTVKNSLLLTGPPTSGEFRPILSGDTLKLEVVIDGHANGSLKFQR